MPMRQKGFCPKDFRKKSFALEFSGVACVVWG
jgi:hypothetical protein